MNKLDHPVNQKICPSAGIFSPPAGGPPEAKGDNGPTMGRRMGFGPSGIFAEVKHALKRAGTPLPLNDVWIAAQALETGAVVATFDAHFASISGLRRWPPA